MGVPESVLKQKTVEVLGLSEFDHKEFTKQIEKVVVNGRDELVFHFLDGRVVPVKWKSTARDEYWTQECRDEMSAYQLEHGRDHSNACFFTGRIHCSRCGKNYYRRWMKIAAGEKYLYWVCSSEGKCEARGYRDKDLKNLVMEALGINEFDEALVRECISDIDILSDTEALIHFSDGSSVIKPLIWKRHMPKKSEKAKESVKEYWRKRHARENQ